MTGQRSDDDVRAVGRTQEALRTRLQQLGSSFYASTMRDPTRPPDIGASAPQTALKPQEAAMTAASKAMGDAVTALTGLSTTDAIPPETEALKQLLKARADENQFQVAMSLGGDSGKGNSNYDLSTLFDRELQRSQQTNYETQSSSQSKPDDASKLLDAIRDLAERQDELLKRQHDLASEPLTPADRARELEKLTRDQAALRQQAEELAAQQSGSQTSQQGQASGGGRQGQSGQRMRDVANAMQAATNDLRRNDAGQAGASGSRALSELRALEQQLSAGQPDASRRAMGDAQLEARQLADAERRIASQLSDPATGKDPDARRRLAGEQDQLAGRADRLQQQLAAEGGQSQAPGTSGARSPAPAGDDPARAAMADAARDLQRRQLGDQMKRAADQLRAGPASPGRQAESGVRAAASALDGVADRLANAAAGDGQQSQELSQQIAAMRGVRERLDQLSKEIQQAGQKPGSASAADVTRLRDEYAQQLQRAQDLLADLRRGDPSMDTMVGFTFEGQGMVLSAPGTEAFKQDFGRWEALRRQADTALQQAESAVASRLQATPSHDRLAAGVDDAPPPAYRAQVDSYFKAIAEGRR